ncbi:MAG: Uncharacterized protein XD81_0354 [Bacteroidetes bacterium 38_7]|nr:MAG: Uncharacterized protein XD81_0354 [Bacteroidetes bacterium 38_7]HAL64173.1 hypothetical protein [Bacteroidales bacterium]
MTQEGEKGLKFGILCDSLQLQYWQALVIEKLISEGNTLALIILNKEETIQKPKGIRRLRAYPIKNFIFLFYYRFLLKPESKRMVTIEQWIKEAILLEEEARRVKKSYYFSEKAIETVKSSEVQFLLRFGFGIIKGDILHAAPYGIWSFHHDDPEIIRGVPSNFWEIVEDIPVNGAILQQLDESIDAGRILQQGWFATINHSWKSNLDQAYYGSISWPAQVCREIRYKGAGCLKNKTFPKPAPMRFAPSNLIMMKFLLKLWMNKVKFHFNELFRAEHWSIAFIETSINDFIENNFPTENLKWIHSKTRRQYYADPAGIYQNHQLKILCEHYDYKSAHGEISLFKINNNSAFYKPEKILLNESWHLAFPFIFEAESNFWCVPESAESNQLMLYRWDIEKKELIFEKILISDIQAVDPFIFYHHQKWWLMFTDKFKSNYSLHLWYAEDFRGPYFPHLNNPVKTDIRSSRPAGNIFYMDGRLMRTAQDCSVISGHRIAINEIIKISPSSFFEITRFFLDPPKLRQHFKGMHTLNTAGPYVIFDVKQHLFVWDNFKRMLSKKLRKTVGHKVKGKN